MKNPFLLATLTLVLGASAFGEGACTQLMATNISGATILLAEAEAAAAGGFAGCGAQIRHRISRSNFFQTIFIVQPAKHILASDPASGRRLIPLNSLPAYWFPLEIWDARPQA